MPKKHKDFGDAKLRRIAYGGDAEDAFEIALQEKNYWKNRYYKKK